MRAQAQMQQNASMGAGAGHRRHSLSDGILALDQYRGGTTAASPTSNHFSHAQQHHSHHVSLLSPPSSSLLSPPPPPIELHAASIQRRWGIADGHLSGRIALRKHLEKECEAMGREADMAARAPGSSANAPASNGCSLVALLSGCSPRHWNLLYRRSGTSAAASPPSSSSIYSEAWELSEQGRFRSVRHYEPSQ